MTNTPTLKETVGEVCRILGVDKANWAVVTRHYKTAVKNGFSHDDFIEAAKNMAAGDPQYKSIYSVFTKTDFWMSRGVEPETPKGIW